MRRMTLFMMALVLLVVASCARGETSPAPPDIRYGEDICDECKMIISDPRFAAGCSVEVSPGRYESKAFDDIGDMLVYMEKEHADSAVAWYVHDYESEEWLDATSAVYVVSENLPTPMGFGIIAFADEAQAESAAAEVGGMVMAWEDLLAMDVGHAHGE